MTGHPVPSQNGKGTTVHKYLSKVKIIKTTIHLTKKGKWCEHQVIESNHSPCPGRILNIPETQLLTKDEAEDILKGQRQVLSEAKARSTNDL